MPPRAARVRETEATSSRAVLQAAEGRWTRKIPVPRAARNVPSITSNDVEPKVRYLSIVGLAAPVVLEFDGPSESSGRGPAAGGRHLAPVGDTLEGRWVDRVISVVVVEDDPAMRLLVRFNLEAAGFRVTLAETGTDGLEAVAAEEPDLVLLDVMLPDMGGFDVARRLSDVPIVFMSAKASSADFTHGRDVGAIDYVSKPFDPVTLPDRLREDLIELDRGGSAAHVWTLRFGRTP